MNSAEIAVLIVAAGRGERAGAGDGPKQYRMIGGKSVLARCLEPFVADKRFARIVVVRHRDDEALYSEAAGRHKNHLADVVGGETRQQSTLNGLNYLAKDPPQYVLIHDAARPFVDCNLLDRIYEALGQTHGVLPALPVTDTLKRGSSDHFVEQTVDRNGLFAAQTPQAFPLISFSMHIKKPPPQRAKPLQTMPQSPNGQAFRSASLPVRLTIPR